MPTSWVYTLNKQDLLDELEKRGISLQTTTTVDELRRQLVQQIRTEEESLDGKELATKENSSMEIDKKMEAFDKALSRWNIQFNATGDAVEFLEKLEDLMMTWAIEKDRVIQLIPRCLRGKASLWFRNNRNKWKSWNDFTDDFKLYYFPIQYETNLLEKIIDRKQRFKEHFIEYLTDIQTLLRRYNKMSPEEQLQRIYNNMSPNYRFYVKRNDFSSLAELIQLAGEYENVSYDRYKGTRPTEHQQHTKETQRPDIKKKPSERVTRDFDPKTSCFNCGKKNHMASECRSKRVTFCIVCGMLGKRSKDCCKKEKGRDIGRGQEACTIVGKPREDNRIFLKVLINNKECEAVVDTGSTNTFINKEVEESCGPGGTSGVITPRKIKLADGTRIETESTRTVEIEANGKKIRHQVSCLPTTPYTILGMDILPRLGIEIHGLIQQENSQIEEKGKVHETAETTLSRNPICAATEEETTWYKNKIRQVTLNPQEQTSFCIREGKLYKKITSPQYGVKLSPDTEWKLCIDKDERQDIVKLNHDVPNAGHLGTAKTINKIAQRYYWPGMFRDVATYIGKCDACQKHKPTQEKTPGLMHIKNAQEPWEIITTDLIGPLPRSSKGYQWIIVFHDKFTKWSEIKPLRTATANSITNAFKECIIMRYGCPKEILTDNGKSYVNKQFKSTLERYGIKHRLTAPYAPQSNPTERVNRTLETMIATFIEKNHKKWDEYIHEFNFALNTSVQESTKYTPAFLLFGRELRNICDTNYFPTPAIQEKQKMKEIYEIVRTNQTRASIQQKNYYDKKRKEWKLEIDDKVLKKDHPLSKADKNFCAKLAPKYSGPYRIIGKKSPVVYELQNTENNKKCTAHIKDLKKYN